MKTERFELVVSSSTKKKWKEVASEKEISLACLINLAMSEYIKK